jgi:hypothetical protein
MVSSTSSSLPSEFLESAKLAVLGQIDPGETRTFDQIVANRALAGYQYGTLMVAFKALEEDIHLIKIAGRYTRVR